MSLKLTIDYRLGRNNVAIKCQFPSQGISAIYGPSGIGKTSLLRLIAGLDRPVSGDIVFNKEVWFSAEKTISPQQRRVGFVFQDSRLFPHLDVRANLMLAYQQAQGPTFDIEQLCGDFGIADLLILRANKLSAGQQQRVAIVRSLLAQPQLLLLDEPMAALDDGNKQLLIRQLKIHSEKYTLPMIYVSHNASEIDQLCSQLLLLKHDGNVEMGHASTLLDQYLQHQVEVIAADDKRHQISLALTPEQYRQYKKQSHLLISNIIK